MPRLGVPSTTDFRRACCAPTSAYATTLAANRSPCHGRPVPGKTVDLTALSRVSFNPQLTPKKGRKEGTWRPTWPRVRRPPHSSCRATAASSVSLADFKGRKLVIYFYPKADTPGCTQESIDFSKLRGEFSQGRDGYSGSFGRSGRRAGEIQEEARSRRSRCSPTRPTRCSRPTGSGAKNPCTARPSWESSGSTFLIGQDGRIARIWPKVKVAGHAAEVLAAAKAL